MVEVRINAEILLLNFKDINYLGDQGVGGSAMLKMILH
jgi:hypothetical protein